MFGVQGLSCLEHKECLAWNTRFGPAQAQRRGPTMRFTSRGRLRPVPIGAAHDYNWISANAQSAVEYPETSGVISVFKGGSVEAFLELLTSNGCTGLPALEHLFPAKATLAGTDPIPLIEPTHPFLTNLVRLAWIRLGYWGCKAALKKGGDRLEEEAMNLN